MASISAKIKWQWQSIGEWRRHGSEALVSAASLINGNNQQQWPAAAAWRNVSMAGNKNGAAYGMAAA